MLTATQLPSYHQKVPFPGTFVVVPFTALPVIISTAFKTIDRTNLKVAVPCLIPDENREHLAAFRDQTVHSEMEDGDMDEDEALQRWAADIQELADSFHELSKHSQGLLMLAWLLSKDGL